MWWVWWLACPKRTSGIEERIGALLVQADEAFEQRDELGLEAAAQPLREAYGLDASHPAVAWRLARQQIAQGLAARDPLEARTAFAEARASSMQCLESDAGFVSRRTGQGWAEALTAVAGPREPCVAWLALAWVRWTLELGPAAAALDLETIDTLLVAARQYDERKLRSVVSWAEALTLASRPEWAGRDLAQARAAFDEALQLDQGATVRRVDRYRYLLVSEEESEAEAERERLLAMTAQTPEDKRALVWLAQMETSRDAP